MKNYLISLCFLAVVYSTWASKAPFITKCTAEDTKCITDSSQVAIPIMAEGIPELGVEKMDPLHIPSVDASSPNLKLVVNDVEVVGLKKCKATKIQRDPANSKILVDLICTVTVTAQYDMKGKISVLPIEGNGKLHVGLNSIHIHADVDVEEKDGKDAKKHWNIKKWNHNFELKEKCTLKFENLFGGNEGLAKAVEDFIAENSNDIISEIGKDIIKAVVAVVAKNCNKLFHAVPMEDLALN